MVGNFARTNLNDITLAPTLLCRMSLFPFFTPHAPILMFAYGRSDAASAIFSLRADSDAKT